MKGENNLNLSNTMGTLPKEKAMTIDRMETLLNEFKLPVGSTGITHQAFDESNPMAGAIYNIPDNRLEEVMCAVDALVANGGNFPLLEKITPVIGAVFDLDFKFKCDLPSKSFLNQKWIEDNLRPFVSALNQLYREHLHVEGAVSFIVQQRVLPYERSNTSQGKFVCDGFHILAPGLRATLETHTALRAIGLQRGLLNKFKFPVEVLEDANKWWDAAVVRPNGGNSWFVFGLGKVGRPPYKTIFKLKSLCPVEEENGTTAYPMKALVVSDEAKFRREASYAINRAVPALPIKDEMAKALLEASTKPKPMPQQKPVSEASDPGTPTVDATDFIIGINKILNLPSNTQWQIKEKSSRKFCGKPITTQCLCGDFQHHQTKQSQIIVNATTKKSGKPSAVVQCFDYTNNHGIVKVDETKALQLYGVLFTEPDDDLDDGFLFNHPNYMAVRETFEQEVVKIKVPVCFNVKIEDEWLSLTEDKLKQLFKNTGFVVDKGDVGKVRLPFINTWLTDPNMLTYTRFAFYPDASMCPETHFNEFKGWAFERYTDAPPVECPELLEVILALCGGEPEAMEYVLDFMGQIIQEPLIKSGVCLCFGGQQGTGKDFVWDWFRKFILGDDLSLMTAQPETDLFGSFTTRIKNRLLIKVEEGEGKTFHGNSDKFKSFITSPTTTYHPKGIDPTTINFPARFILTTNNFNAVKVEEEDRRYAFFKAVAHAHAQDRVWFGALAAKIGNCEKNEPPKEPGVITWFVNMLKSRKVVGKNWISDRPKTLQWKLMRTMNMPYHYHFLEFLCFEGNDFLREDKADPYGRLVFKATDLFKAFNDWKLAQGHTGEKNSMTATKFFCLMKEMSIPDDGITSGRNNQGSIYTLKPRAIRKWLVAKNYISNTANSNINDVGDVKKGCLINE